MDKFTASNGIPITLTEDGRLIVENADHTYPATIAAGEHVAALREFFRAEEDERLGRWRWGTSDIVVRPVIVNETDYVRAWDESTGNFLTFSVDTIRGLVTDDPTQDERVRAMRAYLDAQPRKPWHNAKAGEVWVLDANEFSGPNYVEDSDHFTGGRGFRHVVTRDRGPGILAPYIKDAHRIWPEGNS